MKDEGRKIFSTLHYTTLHWESVALRVPSIYKPQNQSSPSAAWIATEYLLPHSVLGPVEGVFIPCWHISMAPVDMNDLYR